MSFSTFSYLLSESRRIALGEGGREQRQGRSGRELWPRNTLRRFIAGEHTYGLAGRCGPCSPAPAPREAFVPSASVWRGSKTSAWSHQQHMDRRQRELPTAVRAVCWYFLVILVSENLPYFPAMSACYCSLRKLIKMWGYSKKGTMTF